MTDRWIVVTPRKTASKRTPPTVTPEPTSPSQVRENKKHNHRQPERQEQATEAEDWWDSKMSYSNNTQILPTYLKDIRPTRAPNILDVVKFRRELASALAQCGTEYPKGVGYSFIVEDTNGYRKRTGQASAVKPTKPPKPNDPGDFAGSAAWKRYEYRLHAYQEWDIIQGETIQAILTKFPTMLMEYKDKTYQTLPVSMTPEEAMDAINEQVFSKKKARELYANLTQQITTLEYKPTSVGPAQYFQDVLDLQYQANQLGQAAVTDEALLTYALLAFCRSGHDRNVLSKLEEEWDTIADNVPTDDIFPLFRKYWVKKLAGIYTEETTSRQAANLTERLADLERTLRSDVSQLYDNQEELASAFQTVTQTSSTDTPSVLSTPGSSFASNPDDIMTQFKEGIAAIAQLTKELRHTGLQATNPPAGSGRNTAPSSSSKPYRQWKYWCYTCGVNLSHNTKDCKRTPKATGHNEHHSATMEDPQGGNVRRNHLWHKWCHPVTHMPHDSPH